MMLRFAHRILTNLFVHEDAKALPWISFVSAIGEKGTFHVIANNVNRYLDSVACQIPGEADGERGISMGDIPACRPPFSQTFVEWDGFKQPFLQAGVLLASAPFEDERLTPVFGGPFQQLERFRSAGSQITMGLFFWGTNDGRAYYDGNCEVFVTDKSGRIPDSGGVSVAGRQYKGPGFVVALFAVGFMNCKNVARVDVTDTEGPSEKWLRRQKHPKLRYHVLEINPMKEVLRTEGGSETNGLKKALHICRGHFATYTEEHPLFGHFVGTVWKRQHKRGSADHGITLKDYAVNPGL